jgi:hypothetical protein
MFAIVGKMAPAARKTPKYLEAVGFVAASRIYPTVPIVAKVMMVAPRCRVLSVM